MKKILFFFFLSRIAFGQDVVYPTPIIATIGSTINVYFTNPSNNAGPFEVRLYKKILTSCPDTCRANQTVAVVAYANGNSSAISLEIPVDLEPTGSSQLIECRGKPCDTYVSYCLTICPSNCKILGYGELPSPCYNIELIEGIIGGGGGSVLQSLNLSQSQICQNETLTATFQHQKINPDNNFTVELSDQNGNFGSPTASTTIVGNTATTASLVIPPTAPSSNGYILRVKSSYPVSSIQSNLSIGILSPPTITNTIVTAGNLASLTAACTNGAVKWYDQALGGTLLQSGNSYSTPVLTANTTYFASCEGGSNCLSQRTPVTVIINVQIPSQPESFTESSASVCKGKSNVIYTVPNVAGVTYNWSYSGTGATFSSTTNSVSISFGMNATAGTLSVTATNSAGTSPARTLDIVLQNSPCESKLIAYYPLNGNANDASGNNLHGIINGSVTATTDRFGNANGAMNFVGNLSSYILVNDNPILRPRNITISVWIKPTSTNHQSFVGKILGNCYNNSWSLGSDGSNLSSWVWTTNTGCGDFQNIVYPNFPLNTWVHLTQVVDDDNNIHKFYVNGTLVSSQALNTSIIYDSSPVTFGIDSDATGYPNLSLYFQGNMDDVRFYNYALNDSEIANIYAPNCTPTISSNSPICSGNQLTLSSSTASTYAWVGPNGFASSTQNVAIPNTDATNAGVYTLTVDNGIGCTATATTNVVISSLPNLTINSNSPLCIGNTINLSVTNSNNTGNSGSFNNSSNQFVDVPQTLPTDNFTIEMWIKTSQSEGGLFETGAGPNGPLEGDKFIYIEGGILKARIIPVPILGLSSGITVNDNNWHHVAVTQTTTGGEGTKIYIDGTFAADYPNSTQCASMSNFQIGTENNLGWQNSNYRTFYNGLIDNVRVWDVVKNATQIAQGMNEDSPSNTPNLVYYQKFENNVNATVGTNGTTPNGLSYTNVNNSTYAWSGPNGFSSTGQNPSRNNATIAFGGIYTVTVTNTSGCSATATTNVVVNNLPNPTASSNTPVCLGSNLNLSASGGISYLWTGPNGFSSTGQNPSRNNATIAFGGIYTVTVTNTSGCSATATTNVVVNNLPNPTASSNTPVCLGSNLNLSASGGTSYLWAGPNGFSSTGQNPSRNNATIAFGGIYTVTVTNTNVCSATATTNVVVNNLPNPTASSNTPVCLGRNLTLSASGGTSYLWTGPNGFSSTVQNPSRNNATIAFGGIYTVTVTNTNVCSATATTNVVVNNLPNPTASSNTPVCLGRNLTLSASGGTSYLWTGPNGFSSTGQNPSRNNATIAFGGIYTVTVSSGVCSATATTSVVVNNLPNPTASSNTPVCLGRNLTLSASGGTSYLWTGPNGFSSTVQNPSRNNATIAFGGIYTVTVTNTNVCSATATTNVVVNNLPNPTASSNTPVCLGSNLNLSASGGISYLWTGPNGFSSTVQNPSRNNATIAFGGIYTVTVTNTNVCSTTATTNVVVNNLPNPTASSNTPVCLGGNLNLSASGGTGYLWAGPNGFSSTGQNPSRNNATIAFGGIYTVTVTNTNVCSTTVTTSVVVNASITPSASNNSPVCIGSNLNLSASGGTSYLWTGPNGFSSTGQNPSRNNATIAFGGIYTVTVSSGVCSATATTSVSVSSFVSPPNVSFEPCNGELFKLWDKSFGGSEYDELIKIVQPSHLGGNGLLLAGNSSSNINIAGGKTENSKGLQDFWIVNVNGFDGSKSWDKTFGGNLTETLTSALIVSGGYLLGGYTDSGISGDVSEASRGGIDYWVIKVDFNGNKIWDKRFGGSGEDKLHAIITTPDGFLLGGQSNSDISGDRTQSSRGGSDFWVVKIDIDGNKIWDKRFGGNSTDNIYTMYNYGSNFLLGGVSLSDQNGDKTQPSQGQADFWLVNIDTNGNKVWDKRFGGNQTDQLWTINSTIGDGGILLGGTSYSDISGDQTQQRKGILGDFWVVKLNSLGNKVWDKRYGGDGHDFLTSVSITTDGNGGFLLGGITESGQSGDITQPEISRFDFQVIKIDDNGNKVWDKKFNAGGSEQLNSIFGAGGSGQVLLGGGNGNFLLTKTVACRSEAKICAGQSITLSASNCTGNITWSNGSTSSTITVNSNGTYTATCSSNGCISAASNSITVTTNAIPAQPTASGQTIVIGNSATLSANGCTNYKWYTQAAGGFSVFNGQNFITPILSSNTNYYVSCDTGLPCESARVLVPVVTIPCPSSISVSSLNYTNETITRQASATNGLITATNQITNTAKIIYQSKAILLTPGFKAVPISNGYFKAEIGGCN